MSVSSNTIELSGLLFEAMIQDSVNLRQKLLWTYKQVELSEAGNIQINCFEESIKNGLEDDYIIEEYKNHLKSFKEWLEILLLDAQVITAFRIGSEAFTDGNDVDSALWYRN